MRYYTCLLFLMITGWSVRTYSQQTIHIYVPLCDNLNQGIVPVPEKLGNGEDPANNLYWGAAYGVKSYFQYKTSDWKLVKDFKMTGSVILDRVLFKHTSKDVYVLADAYQGDKIKQCIREFLYAANGQHDLSIEFEGQKLNFGGSSNLVAYAGHDGLMEFDVAVNYQSTDTTEKKDVIILACYSKEFFNAEITKANANPILWTTHLMAPEAYTLKAAFDGWLNKESGSQIDERAAQAYHKYQKCGIRGARNLFTTGF